MFFRRKKLKKRDHDDGTNGCLQQKYFLQKDVMNTRKLNKDP